MRRLRKLLWACCLLIVGVSALARAADTPKKLDETLRRFYEAYTHGQWKTAEQFVDPESRDVFRSQTHPGILKYEIKKIEMKNEGTEALVTVGVDQAVQMVGKVVTLSAQTQWRMVKGKWYMIIMAPPPIPAAMAGFHPTSDRPTPDLKFETREFDFGRKTQGDVVTIEFPFVNVADHPVQVAASLVSFCNCIEVKVSKETVAPGESAKVLFKVDTSPFTFYYHQGIGVTVQPGDGSAILDITGFLVPAADNPPAETPKPR